MQMLARVQESQATFTEVKIMAGLTRPLQGTGRLFYRRPSHLEKVTFEPQPERLVVDGNRLTLAEGNAPPQIIELNGEPVIRTLVDAMRGTLSGDLASLQRSYRVSIEGEIAAWRLNGRSHESVPFAGPNAIAGQEFPDTGGVNQYMGTRVTP